MKRLIVEVCVCPECVMMGAMDIIEAIESLEKAENPVEIEYSGAGDYQKLYWRSKTWK